MVSRIKNVVGKAFYKQKSIQIRDKAASNLADFVSFSAFINT
jgi:hypothetical protein